MKKTISILLLALFISCGGKGVEGNVGQIISISAEENLEEPDTDYNWIIITQPDGSLLSPKDLKYNNNGQEMIFIPDYPGDYVFEVSMTKFGDELSSQSFFFSISDPENLESNDEMDEPDKETRRMNVNSGLFTRTLWSMTYANISQGQCFECIRVCPVDAETRKLG